MTVAVFVDTNVLVYSRDGTETLKQPLAQEWRAQLWQHRAGRLSTQVLQEFYVTVTRKLKPGLSRELARREVADLTRWRLIEMSPLLLEAAFDIEDEHALSFWDALLVAGSQAARCGFLLTEDLQAGAKLGGVAVVDPFKTTPAEILGALQP